MEESDDSILESPGIVAAARCNRGIRGPAKRGVGKRPAKVVTDTGHVRERIRLIYSASVRYIERTKLAANREGNHSQTWTSGRRASALNSKASLSL